MLQAIEPQIRGSDLDLLDTCRFRYFLVRRLGLRPIDSFAEALAAGSAFHKLCEWGVADKERFEEWIKKNLKEIREQYREHQLPDSWLENRLEKEKQVAWSAFAWYIASDRYRPRNTLLQRGWQAFDRHMRTLVIEPEITVIGEKGVRHTSAPDKLVFDEATNLLWLDDYKTTSSDPRMRAETCPIEFACRHYLSVAHRALPILIERFGLPPETKIGGMRHIIIRKPGITFGREDCLKAYVSTGKKGITGISDAGKTVRGEVSGTCRQRFGVWEVDLSTQANKSFKDEGQAIAYLHEQTGKTPTFQTMGEPILERYIERCTKRYENAEQAMVAVSFSKLDDVLDSRGQREYDEALKRLTDYATREPVPENFDRTKKGMARISGALDLYAPFYVAPVKAWPTIMREERLTVSRREEREVTRIGA